MSRQVNLEQVTHMMQVRYLWNVNKQTAAQYAGRANLQPGQTMIVHNLACTVTRRITRLLDGTLEVGLMRPESLPYTVSSLHESAMLERDQAKRNRKLAVCRKFIKANRLASQRY